MKIVFAIALALTSSMSGAASYRAMELPEIVSHSQSVLHCRVVDVETTLKSTPHGEHIYTHYLLEVTEDWLTQSGSSERYQSLWVRGGEIDGKREQVLGYPKLGLGLQYVLFIENYSSGLPITGGTQGVFKVTQSKSGQTRVIPLSRTHTATEFTTLRAIVQTVGAQR